VKNGSKLEGQLLTYSFVVLFSSYFHRERLGMDIGDGIVDDDMNEDWLESDEEN
jgi:hypothetical protein